MDGHRIPLGMYRIPPIGRLTVTMALAWGFLLQVHRSDMFPTQQNSPVFSADETTDIGDDYGMPVSPEYLGRSKFNGKIYLVQIDIGDDNHDHMIDPADVIRVAISRQ